MPEKPRQLRRAAVALPFLVGLALGVGARREPRQPTPAESADAILADLEHLEAQLQAAEGWLTNARELQQQHARWIAQERTMGGATRAPSPVRHAPLRVETAGARRPQPASPEPVRPYDEQSL